MKFAVGRLGFVWNNDFRGGKVRVEQVSSGSHWKGRLEVNQLGSAGWDIWEETEDSCKKNVRACISRKGGKSLSGDHRRDQRS